MSENLVILADENDAGERLDRVLDHHLEDWSRSILQRWIRSGCVTLEGRQLKPSYRVRTGDSIRVLPPPPTPSELIPEAIPLSIVYEDDWLVVVDKPAGLVVHPGAGRPSGTLANALVYHFGQISRKETVRPGIVHRLDKDTSGLLIVAKNEAVHQKLAVQFKDRVVDKEYLALTYGRVDPREGLIDRPVGRHHSVRTKMSVHSRTGRAATTEYRLVRYLGDFSYVRVKLHTGRTHQIRVHFQCLGHPVVGDLLYGGLRHETISDTVKRKAVKSLERHFLHAERLGFEHPASSERMEFRSPLPDDLVNLLACLE